MADLTRAEKAGAPVEYWEDAGDGTYKRRVSANLDAGTVATETTLASIAAAVKQNDAAWGATHYGAAVYGVRDDALTTLGVADGDYTPARIDANGAVWVQLAGALSPSTDGVYLGAATSGGGTPWDSQDLDETEEEVKATAGTLLAVYAVNNATANRYLKFYNATAANTTVGTTTPVWVVELVSNATDDVGHSIPVGPYGIAFDTAITCAVTTGSADNDTGAPGANDVMVSLVYK